MKEQIKAEQCGYCHTALEGSWVSVHEQELHYKKTTCSGCEKESWVKADFLGDGNDSWSEKKKPGKPLDDFIKEIESM